MALYMIQSLSAACSEVLVWWLVRNRLSRMGEIHLKRLCITDAHLVVANVQAIAHSKENVHFVCHVC